MTFASPQLLLALLLVPAALAAYLLVQRRRSRYAVRFTNVDLLANLVPAAPRWRRHVPPILYLVAIAALGIALARPSVVVPVPREEATVILTMDTSRSMLATDVAPSRLAAAQAAATTFVDKLPAGFRVGLVAFSTDARLLVPPTTDRIRIKEAIDALRADGGTAMGDAIGLSLQAADAARTALTPGSDTNGSAATPDPSTPPDASASPDPAAPGAGGQPLVAAVLLSDGANSTGSAEPLDAAAQAKAAGVPVYTIALGTANGVVEVTDDLGNPHQLQVPPDSQTLRAIAQKTGGRFFEAPTADDLSSIYQSLGSKVGFTQEQQEVTQWFAAAALLLVLGGAGLAAVWFNRFP